MAKAKKNDQKGEAIIKSFLFYLYSTTYFGTRSKICFI